MAERFRPYAAVYALLEKDGKIFLIRRFNTGWQDGMYTPPTGHLEARESIAGAMARETKEEVGVDVKPEDFKVVHVMHRRYESDREYLDMYLAAQQWKGTPTNVEVNKADDGKWFALDEISDDVILPVRIALENYRKGIFFSEFGWDG